MKDASQDTETLSDPTLAEASGEAEAAKQEGGAGTPTRAPPAATNAVSSVKKENVAPATVAGNVTAPPSTPPFKKLPISTTPLRNKGSGNGQHNMIPRTPPSVKKAVPIAALTPYNMAWTIRARVSNKAPLRSFARDGTDTSVFTVELVDDLGSTIEGTLWAEFADEHYDKLDEGKVYLFSNGKVKPANRRYSGLRSDYCINFDTGSSISECDNQDVSNMDAKADYVTIDRLPAFVGKKALVDVLGIVMEVTPLGSVKRKSDNTELNRRDVTLVDASSKTVRVTFWGQLGEDLASLESMEAPVISVTSCRVSDFDGVSLSSVQRSKVVIGDDIKDPAAAKLRKWYDTIGNAASVTPIGETLSMAARGESGGVSYTSMAALQSPPEGLPPTDAKPQPFMCSGAVVLINSSQVFYYTATPENKFRKVTPVEDGWHCEFDGKTYSRMVRRYMLLIKMADSSGEASLNLFNDEAEKLLGMSADELHELREGDPGGELPVLEKALWTDWTLKVQTRSKEYNGQTKLRVNVMSMQRTDYDAESARMLAEIAKLTAA